MVVNHWSDPPPVVLFARLLAEGLHWPRARPSAPGLRSHCDRGVGGSSSANLGSNTPRRPCRGRNLKSWKTPEIGWFFFLWKSYRNHGIHWYKLDQSNNKNIYATGASLPSIVSSWEFQPWDLIGGSDSPFIVIGRQPLGVLVKSC